MPLPSAVAIEEIPGRIEDALHSALVLGLSGFHWLGLELLGVSRPVAIEVEFLPKQFPRFATDRLGTREPAVLRRKWVFVLQQAHMQ